jgi:hypothetical protein
MTLSAIFQLFSWRPVLVVEEAGVPGENPERTTDHGQATGKLYQQEKKCCHTQCPYTSHNVFRKGKICVKQNKYGKTVGRHV